MKINQILTIILITLFSAINAFTQINQSTTTQNTQNSHQNTSTSNQNSVNFKVNSDTPDLLNQFSTQSSQQKSFPVDKAVNPDLYQVGPNDMFNLGIYGYINQTVPLVVNLEGSLVIPTIGEIKVDGLTLTEAKSKVIKAVKKRYYSSEVSLSLTMPRLFLISVHSSVQKKMEVTPLTRTSDIISLVYYDTLDISKMKYRLSNQRGDLAPELSMRNIEILHKDGSTANVDLYQYFSTNDDKYNPYFREGDLLKIPYGQLIKNYVTVEGAVQLPGLYEYNKNDNLESIIALGRSFDAGAEQDSISIFRVDPATSKFTTFNLSYSNDKNFKIEVYDRIFVKFKTDNIKSLSVTVLGEINRPGTYPITQKNTTLKEIVEMAGGFKPTAFLPLCILFRKYDEEYIKKDTAEILLNMRANDLIIKEKDKTNFENDVQSRRNRVTVDFEKLFKENDLSQNVILENKDVIYINDDKKIVYVYGQVSNEGYVPFKEGANYEYYIEKAGGYSLAAEEGDTRIIRFNSRGWYKADKTSVQSGDFIYVPKVVRKEFSENLTIIYTVIASLTSIISTYLLVKANR
jgi:polysaccharide biosynthesis/export protein